MSWLDGKTPPMNWGESIPNPGKSILETFTKDEIEYASIWAQLGPNQEMDELKLMKLLLLIVINDND